MDKSSQDPCYPDREMKSKATGSTGKNLVLPLFLTKTWMSCSGCWWRGCPRPLSSRLGCRHCPPRHVIVTATIIRNTGSFAPSGAGGSSSSPSSSSPFLHSFTSVYFLKCPFEQFASIQFLFSGCALGKIKIKHILNKLCASTIYLCNFQAFILFPYLHLKDWRIIKNMSFLKIWHR